MIDFYVTEAGREQELPRCTPANHVFRYNCLCFVLSGYGYFNGLKLGIGNGFICLKGNTVEYYPDSNDPWELFFVRFSPEEQTDFAFENNMFFFDRSKQFNNIMSFILASRESLHTNREFGTACYLLVNQCIYSSLPPERSSIRQQHVQQVKKYIAENYYKKLSIESIAQEMHISRSYLRNIFSAEEGSSPKQYLIETRIRHAKQLLETFSFSVSEVAQSVGYDDEFQFSKIFKKYTGVSPAAYRTNEFMLSKDEYGDFIYFWEPSRHR